MSLQVARLETQAARPQSSTSLRRLIALLVALWLGVVLYAVSAVVYGWPDMIFSLDFTSFWSGASLLRDHVGSGLYDLGVQQAFQQALHHQQAASAHLKETSGFVPYWNPPPLLLLFLPLSLLPITWAYLVWLSVSLGAFAMGVAMPLRGAPQGRARAVALLTYMGVAGTLLEGQVNGISLLAFSLGLMALISGRRFLGGVLLGALWLKPQYALLFPLIFVVKGRWREAMGMVAGGLLVGLASLAMIGPDGISRYLSTLGQVGGYYSAPGSLASPVSMTNWRALLLNLLPGLSEEAGAIVMWALGIATALLSLLAWRGPWDARSPRFALQMLVTVAATLIVSPHSHLHGTVLLLAPLALTRSRTENPFVSSRLWQTLLAAGYTLALLAWAFRGLSWLFVPFLVASATVVVLGLRSTESEVGQ